MVKVKCKHCGNFIEKRPIDVKRSETGNFFCSRKCLGLSRYNPFLYYIRRSKQGRGKIVNLTPEYLETIWNNQKGKCVYSGIDMVHQRDEIKSSIRTASLDRIDSNIDYIEGNVQFVTIHINNMKNILTHLETIELINIIKNGDTMLASKP